MDEHERALRKRGGSNSSVESFSSSNNGSPREDRNTRRSEDVGHAFGTRSGTWNGRRSEDHSRENGNEGLASKVKGRLRAFTGERRNVKGSPYPGN